MGPRPRCDPRRCDLVREQSFLGPLLRGSDEVRATHDRLSEVAVTSTRPEHAQCEGAITSGEPIRWTAGPPESPCPIARSVWPLRSWRGRPPSSVLARSASRPVPCYVRTSCWFSSEG